MYYLPLKNFTEVEEKKLKCLNAFDSFINGIRTYSTNSLNQTSLLEYLGLNSEFIVDFDIENSYVEFMFSDLNVYLIGYLKLLITDRQEKSYHKNEYLYFNMVNGDFLGFDLLSVIK